MLSKTRTRSYRMRRMVVLLIVAAGLLPASAQAWSWPASGPVLRPFLFGDDPYAPGLHRGIDVSGDLEAAAPAAAAGMGSFVGTVPKGGKTFSIGTPDGYTVALQPLGSSRVRMGDWVRGGTPVAPVGTPGELDWDEPYLYLSVRRTDE